MTIIDARHLVAFGLLLGTPMLLHADPVLTVELPADNSLTAGVTVDFGGPLVQYFDPSSQTQAPDLTHTVTFAGVPQGPYHSYSIQVSTDGQFGWTELFAPGLEPGPTGAIRFVDSSPREVAFYRLLVAPDTRRTFTIRNIGSTDLTDIAVTLVGADSSFFELDTLALDTILAPDAITTFAITYVAPDNDVHTAELRTSANVPEPFVLNLQGGIVRQPSLVNVAHVPAGPATPAAISGSVIDGPGDGSVFLEASSDFGQSDAWVTIATITLDTNGGAQFGVPTLVVDQGSTGLPWNFYRLRVE